MVILGIGNPGDEYRETYHNVGHLFVDFLAEKYSGDFKVPSKKSFSLLKGERVTLAHSLLYMNGSGKASKELLSYIKKDPKDLVVAHDDSDITIGSWKITFDQRSAGHKGVESIIHLLKSQKFWRIKIGIRPKQEHRRKKAEEFVLKKITTEDRRLLKETFEIISNTNLVELK